MTGRRVSPRKCGNGCDKPVHADGMCNTCYVADRRADQISAPTTARSDQPCGTCGKVHTRCTSHRSANHATDPGGACAQNPVPGLTVCRFHGGAPRHARAAGERRVAEQKITEAARKLIPDVADRAAITNPLETLLELASEANAFRESLRGMANELEGQIRYAGTGGTGEQLRAEVATYRQALKDTTDLLIAIARLDIEAMLARMTLRQGQMVADILKRIFDDLHLTDEQRALIPRVVPRHLRAVNVAS